MLENEDNDDTVDELIAGVPIILKDATGTVAIETTATDSTGSYLFSNVVLGLSLIHI